MKTITLTIQTTVPDDVADDTELLDILRDAAKQEIAKYISLRYPRNLQVSIESSDVDKPDSQVA